MTAAALVHPPTTTLSGVGPVTVTFSPKGDAEALVVKAIDAAVHSVAVQAYEFSSHPICDAILRAYQRGLQVMVLLDKQNKVNALSKWVNVVGRNSLMPVLRTAGVPVLLDSSVTIAHSKVVIVDGSVVVTGSFNFSKGAQTSNAENLLVIRDAALAAAYLVNFNWRLALSKPV